MQGSALYRIFHGGSTGRETAPPRLETQQWGSKETAGGREQTTPRVPSTAPYSGSAPSSDSSHSPSPPLRHAH